jgi:hypothetical protein
MVENGRKIISVAKERVRLQVTSLYDSLISILYGFVLEISIYPSPFKSYSTFLIYMQNALQYS